MHLTHWGRLPIPRAARRIVLKSLLSASLHSNKRVHSTPCRMQIIIYNKYIPFTVFHPRILRQHDCSGLFTFLYTFIPFLYTRAYESFCRMQAGYCDRFECESIIFNMPGRDRVPLGGGWWTNSVGGLTRDDECIIPKNVYRLPSYRPVPSLPVLPSGKWLKPKVHELPHAQRKRK